MSTWSARVSARDRRGPEGFIAPCLLTSSSEGDGERLFHHACLMGLEGIVAKRKGSRYTSGRCRHWLKIKNPGWLRT